MHEWQMQESLHSVHFSMEIGFKSGGSGGRFDCSDQEASHQVAMQQMRGGFSNEIQIFKRRIINFASLIELELILPRKM